MYIVTNNKPFYPEIEYCDDIVKVRNVRDRWTKEYDTKDGKYEVQITIAKVISSIKIKTDF